MSISRFGFRFGWCLGRSVSSKLCQKLQIVTVNCKTSLEFSIFSPESANFCWNLLWFGQIWLNPTRYGQDLTKFGLILPDFAYSFGRVEWLKFWRRKLATRPTGVNSWKQRLAADRLEFWFRLELGWHRWFGQVFGLQSSLDSLNPMLYLASDIAALVCDYKNLLD